MISASIFSACHQHHL